MIRRAIPASIRSSSRRADRAKTTEYSGTPASPATEHAFLYAIERFSRLRYTLLCQGTIVEVFPQTTLLLEIDLDGGLRPELSTTN